MTTGVLRNPDFLRFLGSHVSNELGANIARVAFPLVAVVTLHATPFEVGALSALQSAAFLIVGLPAGVWVDRLRRRRILLTSDLARFLLLGSIPLAAVLDLLSMPLLYSVALLSGIAQVFNDVADQTYLPMLVSKDGLAAGNAQLELARSGGALAGPGLGGLVAQLLGPPVAVLATALGALSSVVLLATIGRSEPRPPVSERSGMWAEIREGLSFVWKDRLQRSIVIATMATNLCVSAVLSLSVMFLASVVHLAPGVIGVLLVSGAAGGIIGGLLAAWLFERYGTAKVTWLALALSSPFGLLLPLTEADWRIAFFAAASVMLSIGAILYNIGTVTYRQTVAPPRLLGRVNASVRFLVWGAMPIGAFAGGLVAQQIGVREALWVFMGGRLLSFLPLLFSPLRRLRDFAGSQASS
jgi:MFS family permease